MNIPDSPDLSIVIPALHEAENLRILLPKLRAVLEPLDLSAEIIVVDELADDKTRAVVAENSGILLMPNTRGYGPALLAGLHAARSETIVTMDADLSHPPEFVKHLWLARQEADILIASRYVPGGKVNMPKIRWVLSRILNVFFSYGLGLCINDMSSGFRLYAKQALDLQCPYSTNFNILQELLVRAASRGCTIREIPFTYQPRHTGVSHARIFQFGLSYLKTFFRLWRLRGSRKP